MLYNGFNLTPNKTQALLDFSLLEKGSLERKGRPSSHSRIGLAISAFFTEQRSGCVPAEPYPLISEKRITFNLAMSENYVRETCQIRDEATTTMGCVCILTYPVCCPNNGEYLIILHIRFVVNPGTARKARRPDQE